VLDDCLCEPLVVDQAGFLQAVERLSYLLGLEADLVKPALELAPASVPDAQQAQGPVAGRPPRLRSFSLPGPGA